MNEQRMKLLSYQRFSLKLPRLFIHVLLEKTNHIHFSSMKFVFLKKLFMVKNKMKKRKKNRSEKDGIFYLTKNNNNNATRRKKREDIKSYFVALLCNRLENC